MDRINHNTNDNYPLSMINDSHFQLSLPPQSSSSFSLSSSLKIAIWKDERLDYLDIPQGLVEVLQLHGFTIEMILDSEPYDIAEKLGLDPYIGEIIFRETTRAITDFKSI